MSVSILVPTALRSFTGGNESISVEAGTVAGALSKLIEKHPDLLLSPVQPPAGAAEDPAILLCAHGVVFGDTSFSVAPRTIEVKALKSGGARYQLLVDERVFWFDRDPDPLARRLERWCHYFFKDLAPQADVQALDRTSAAGARLRA